MELRRYRASDCDKMAELFYQTVHCVNARDYTKEQLDAWASGTVDLEEWNRSFLRHHTIVAECGNEIVGFGDIDDTGYLDRLKNHQGKGSSGKSGKLEEIAGGKRISVHASSTARPFFEHRGYRVIREQTVIRKGIPLTNFVMEK